MHKSQAGSPVGTRGDYYAECENKTCEKKTFTQSVYCVDCNANLKKWINRRNYAESRGKDFLDECPIIGYKPKKMTHSPKRCNSCEETFTPDAPNQFKCPPCKKIIFESKKRNVDIAKLRTDLDGNVVEAQSCGVKGCDRPIHNASMQMCVYCYTNSNRYYAGYRVAKIQGKLNNFKIEVGKRKDFLISHFGTFAESTFHLVDGISKDANEVIEEEAVVDEVVEQPLLNAIQLREILNGKIKLKAESFYKQFLTTVNDCVLNDMVDEVNIPLNDQDIDAKVRTEVIERFRNDSFECEYLEDHLVVLLPDSEISMDEIKETVATTE